MTIIHITNQGPFVASTNYWESALARAGKVMVSVNDGAIRVLLPPVRYGDLADMRAARHCVLSRGPWRVMGVPDAVEIMWDDGSDAPFAFHLTPESFDILPAEPPRNREWACSVWICQAGLPHQEMEHTCHWRRVPELPWLRAWEDK